MPAALEIPDNLLSTKNGEKIRAFMETVNQVRGVEIVIIDTNGVSHRGTLDLTGKNAVITVRL